MELKLGDYVRYKNEYWYIKDKINILSYYIVNVKTFKPIGVRPEYIKKVSELELSILKYRNIIPKRDLVKGDKIKFIINVNSKCIHGNRLSSMELNTDDIYTVDRINIFYGKGIIVNGYTFSMLEVRLVEE